VIPLFFVLLSNDQLTYTGSVWAAHQPSRFLFDDRVFSMGTSLWH
jgi:hypothetical protein